MRMILNSWPHWMQQMPQQTRHEARAIRPMKCARVVAAAMDFKTDAGNIMKMLSEITKDALELSTSQRLLLARLLLESSESPQDCSLEAETAWEDEICWRMKAVQNGTAQSRSLDEMLVDLDRRFPS